MCWGRAYCVHLEKSLPLGLSEVAQGLAKTSCIDVASQLGLPDGPALADSPQHREPMVRRGKCESVGLGRVWPTCWTRGKWALGLRYEAIPDRARDPKAGSDDWVLFAQVLEYVRKYSPDQALKHGVEAEARSVALSLCRRGFVRLGRYSNENDFVPWEERQAELPARLQRELASSPANDALEASMTIIPRRSKCLATECS